MESFEHVKSRLVEDYITIYYSNPCAKVDFRIGVGVPSNSLYEDLSNKLSKGLWILEEERVNSRHAWDMSRLILHVIQFLHFCKTSNYKFALSRVRSSDLVPPNFVRL
jgi:hypothetical protein